MAFLSKSSEIPKEKMFKNVEESFVFEKQLSFKLLLLIINLSHSMITKFLVSKC